MKNSLAKQFKFAVTFIFSILESLNSTLPLSLTLFSPCAKDRRLAFLGDGRGGEGGMGFF
jgi:hypothetical protein